MARYNLLKCGQICLILMDLGSIKLREKDTHGQIVCFSVLSRLDPLVLKPKLSTLLGRSGGLSNYNYAPSHIRRIETPTISIVNIFAEPLEP